MAKRSASASAGSSSSRPPRAAKGIDASVRILVLSGEEDVLKREKLDELRAAVATVHGESDSVFFDGETAALAAVLDELRTYSLLQPYKLVVVDHADEFVKNFRPAIERYAERPVDQATLVLRCTTWRPGNLDKLIAPIGAICKCEALNRAQAQAWATRRSQAHHGRAIDAAASKLLVERLGADLSVLDCELGKLSVAGTLDQPISITEVEQLTSRSSDQAAWAIQEAVLTVLNARPAVDKQARAQAMIAKLHELIDLAGQDTVPMTYSLADLARKLALAHLMKKQGENERQIASELRLWGPQSGAIFSLLGHLGAQGSQRWFDRAMEMDRRGKSGGGEPVRNLECFCALMADEI